MSWLSIQQAIEKKTGTVSIRGWVYRERGSNKLKFLVLRDATNIIQCIFEKTNFAEEEWNALDKIQIEASIEIKGTIKKDDRAPTGFEVNVESFNIIGLSDTFPITKDQSKEFLADNRHLWIRSRKQTAILKIRSTVFGAIHEYFRTNDFYEYQSPIFQSTQCEGGSSLFEVNYFGKKLFLAQTWQLFAEAGIFSLEKIYTIAPSFRAEKSKTSRHLTEYWHAEMEGAWFSFKDIQDHGEALIKYVVKNVLDKNKPELELLERDTKILKTTLEKPFARITYTEALELLEKKFNKKVSWGKDLRTIEENKLSELYDTPIIITNYPKIVKAFYMKENKEDPNVVHGFDCVAPEGYGELIGGSERESDIEKIEKRLLDEGENLADYKFYLDTRRYGSIPHAGFGLGAERLISWICKLENIKDAIAFPRTPLRYAP
ncbi:asparagine--tRNA ligase [Candidatus Woesearchaeota archaeon]|nr:asparagine--tRNA ligase [Candidatus Woesearchaeota archaeon]|tara:strand:+ start:1014 stop:2309 length:1296 start_codon:yes stop_codon:yes gene_type:complete